MIVEVKINENNLPDGLWWEQDTSCWKAVKCNLKDFGCSWRWQPMNWKAFEKLKPAGEMVPYYPFKKEASISSKEGGCE